VGADSSYCDDDLYSRDQASKRGISAYCLLFFAFFDDYANYDSNYDNNGNNDYNWAHFQILLS